MGSKKLKVWLPFLFAAVMAVGMAIGFKLREQTYGPLSFFKNNFNNNPLKEVVDLIQSKYVDKVAMDSVQTQTIEDLLSHLDPHSVYIPPIDVAMYNEDLQGNFEGIGVEFQIFNDTVNVVNVIDKGPAEKAGLQTGDKIIKVNDSITIAGKHLQPDDVRRILRGPKNSQVSVTILREGQLQKKIIQRGTIPLPSIDAAYMIAPTTGFIRISKFAESTYEEFMNALQNLQKQNMQKLILDIRGNGGGFLNEAVSIADEFLDDEKMIVYTQGEKVPRTEYRCQKPGLFEKGKIVVLIDETSASASEILSGALQDWDRATLIGRRTFGKGLVQQQFQLSNGGAVRLTVARYYTPLGRNIQKPYNKGKEQYEEELIERFHNGEVVIGDTSKPTGQAYKTPAGRIVYGGGGITPDIFVPFDTTAQPKVLTDLFLKGTLNNFAYHYFLNHKKTIASFRSPIDFYIQFNFTAADWTELSNYALRDSIYLNQLPAKAKDELLKKIPAFIARQQWQTEGYIQIANLSDAMITKALQVLQ